MPSREPTRIVLADTPMELATDARGVPQWQEASLRLFSERVRPEDATLASLPPEDAGIYELRRFTHFGKRLAVLDPDDGGFYYGDPCDVTGDGGLCSAPLVTSISTGESASVKALMTYKTDLYAACDDTVFVKGAGDTFSASNVMGGSERPQSFVVFQGVQSTPFLFVGQGATARYWVYDGTTWTQHASAFAAYWALNGEKLFRFVEDSNIWKVSQTEDGGTAAFFGAQVPVGDAAYDGTGIVAVLDALYAFKQDGLFEVNDAVTDDAIDLTGGFLRQLPSVRNGANLHVWKNLIFFPTVEGFYFYDPSSQGLVQCGPELELENRSGIHGYITAAAGDDDWLYACLYSPSAATSYLGKGRFRPGEYPRFDWIFALASWATVTIDSMHISSDPGPNRRLYMGRSDGIVDYIILPLLFDPTRDSAARFATTSRCYLPTFDGAFANFQKDALSEDATLEGLTAIDRYVDVDYRVDDDGSGTWVNVARFDENDPEAVEYDGAAGRRIERRLTLVTNTSATPVIVRASALNYRLRAPDTPTYAFTVLTGKDAGRATVGKQRKPASDVFAAIRTSKQAVGGVSLITPDGDRVLVSVRDYRRYYAGGEKNHPVLQLVDVNAIWKRDVGNIGIYDEDNYDSGVEYG